MRALLGLGRGRQRLRGQAGDSGGALLAHGLMIMHFDNAQPVPSLCCVKTMKLCCLQSCQEGICSVAGGPPEQKCVEVDVECITAVSISQPHSGLSRIVRGTGGGVRVGTLRLQQTGAQSS